MEELRVLLTHFAVGVGYLLVPGFVLVALMVGPAWLVLRRISPGVHREAPVLLVGLGLSGYLVGVVGGNSTSPVASTLITGMVGFVAGLVAYLHTRETSKVAGLRSMASVGLIVLLLSLLLGLVLAGAYKRRFEAVDAQAERARTYLRDVAIPLCVHEATLALEGKLVGQPRGHCAEVDASLRAR